MKLQRILFIACVLTTHAVAAPQTKPATRARLSVEVTNTAPGLLSLRAEQAPLSAVAAELARRLEIKVTVSAALKSQPLTLTFDRLTLEEALIRLAPQVFADYETRTQPGAQPRCLAVYLQTVNEPLPAPHASLSTSSEAIVMEGDTEAGTATGADTPTQAEQTEPPLRVTYEHQLLTVTAHQQPLATLLFAIAVKLGASFDVSGSTLSAASTELSDPVNASLPGLPVEAALRQLSPHLTLYQREALHSGEKQLLRLVLNGKEQRAP